MALDLKGCNFLKLQDFTAEEIRGLLDPAKELKAAKNAGNERARLCGKNIFDQAENRMHTIKAVMIATLGG